MKSPVYVSLLLATLSITETEAILGGRDTSPNEYGYIVAFQNDSAHLCGGCIVSDQHIVTAAHCVYFTDVTFRDYPLIVIAGTNDLNDEETPNRVVAEVHKVYVSVKYNNSYWWLYDTPHDDIAVLKLKGKLDVKGNPALSIINLPERRPNGDYDSYENETAVLVGFGYDYLRLGKFDNGTAREFGNSTRKLKQANLKVLNNNQCTSILPIHRTMICARLIEHDRMTVQGACTGDSGGPLVYNNTLIGIVSATATGCNDNLAPGFFTRITSFIDFIDNSMRDQPIPGMRVVTYDEDHPDGMSVVTY